MEQESSLSIDQIQAHLKRVELIAQRQPAIIETFWNAKRKTFGQESPTETDDHVSSACTCVLSFLDAPGGTLPKFLLDSKDEFVKWLLAARWSSEDLPDPNEYTTPIALATLELLDRKSLDAQRCLQSVHYLINKIDGSPSGAVYFGEYPASGFLTYWTLRALWAASEVYKDTAWKDKAEENRRAAQQIDHAITWAEQEVYRQFSFYLLRADEFDPLEMCYALVITNLARRRAKKPVDHKMINKGLEILFGTQLPNGLWSKSSPIFHYSKRGSVYPFAFETLTAIFRMCFGSGTIEEDLTLDIWKPYLIGVIRTFSWGELGRLTNSEVGTEGWRSNHVLPSSRPQAWATAMVLSFVRGLYVLLRRLVRAEALKQFNVASYSRVDSSKLTSNNWTKNLDSLTILARGHTEVSVKEILFAHLLLPHLNNTDEKKWSLIMFGPPGTAKTSLASEIARVLNWPLVNIGTSDFLAAGADKMAHQAREIFNKLAHLYEAVVFIDEVEEFVRDRKNKETQREGRIITTAMLTLIQDLRDRKSCVLILATNHVENFDAAIKRPGRFDLVLLLKPPSLEEKKRFLREQLGTDYVIETTAEAALDSQRDLIERFTFHDWKSFIKACRTSFPTPLTPGTKKQIDDKLINGLLKNYSDHLTIDEQDWKKWQKMETYIYD